MSAIVFAGTRRRCREKRPGRTDSASGTLGRLPYIGHSTRPTTRPPQSETTKPVVVLRSAATALTGRTYSSAERKFPSPGKDSVSGDSNRSDGRWSAQGAGENGRTGEARASFKRHR